MIQSGTVKAGPASLDIAVSHAIPEDFRAGIREVSSLYVPAEHRRQGHARALVFKLCCDADRHSVVLMVNPDPFCDSEMTAEQLESFYSTFGFVRIQDDPVLMARKPCASLIRAIH